MRKILGFLLICAVAAVLMARLNSHLSFPDTFPILCFLTVIFGLSLDFPARFGALNKDYADLVYYCVAILAVFVIFLGKEGERKRLDLASRIEAETSKRQEAKQKSAAMTEELQTFDFVAGNKFDLLRWVNGRVDAAIKSTEDGREFECKCALEMSVVPAVGGAGDCALVSSFIETGKTGGGILEQKSNAFASAAIAAAESCDKDDAILNAIATDRSQNPRKPETIFRLAARLPVFGTFESGEAKIDVKKLLALLQLDDADRPSARSKLTSDRQQFDDEAAATEADLINLQKEHDASVTKSKSGPGLLASLLYEKYWPYILISALGLKIARVRYI